MAALSHLQEKGWTEQEIQQAEAALNRAEQYDVHFSKIVFWSALVVVVLANIMVSLVLIPFLIVLNQWLLYTLVVVLAGTIGFLYNFLIMDIGHLEKKHHILAAVILPLLALGNLLVTVVIANRFIAELQVNNPPHVPWVIAVVFAAAFILPYVADRALLRKTNNIL